MVNLDEQQLIKIVRDAAKRIMAIYETDFEVENKEDQSPLTAADRASHEAIMESLQKLHPDIPVLSEEGKHMPYEIRRSWRRFWLVDPLDGTKEFVKRNGEFTVNIALIDGEYPVWGIVHVPVTGLTYVGNAEGAYMINAENHIQQLYVRVPDEDSFTLVESRSHPSPELDNLLANLAKRHPNINRIQKGSSLKLCAVAEGIAHLYPRLGPTMEWDTAAGQAVVEAAGGKVIDLQGLRFRYNKENLLNTYFLAIGDFDHGFLIESVDDYGH